MPNYLSQYRSTFSLERLEKDGDNDGRIITVNVSDFGTIDSSADSSTEARNNAMVFIKAYEYALTKICSMNVEIIINVPAGDYFFPDAYTVNDYIVLNAPQYGQIGIYGAGTTGTRPTASQLDDTFTSTKTLLRNYYRTRFHFARNGFSLPGSIAGTTVSSFLFNQIAFFGSSDGYSEQRNDDIRRALSGSYRLQSCAIHGFTTTDASLSSINAGDCYGIASAHGNVDLYSIIVSHCGRGFFATNGGAISSYSPDNTERDIITRTAWEGILSANGSSVRIGDGAAYRSIKTGGVAGVNVLYAYNNGVIVSRNATVNGSAISSSNFTATYGGQIQIGTNPDG